MSTTTTKAQKPRLSLLDIFNMSFGFFGIQIGFALQGGNMSRIFQSLGASEDAIPGLWIAAPLTGLIVQPIIGYLSDRTWTRFGRRKPYFFIGAVLATIALFIMPQSSTVWFAAGMLWILDASINISMEPFRALVGDQLPEEQRNTGFAMQSILIGTGAVLASAAPWLFAKFGLADDFGPNGELPKTVTYSFYVGAVFFFGAVLYTILTTKEYSPEQLKAFEEAKAQQDAEEGKTSLRKGFLDIVSQIATIQFYTWFALFAIFMYATPAITSHVYGITDVQLQSEDYNRGATWVSLCFVAFNGMAAIFGFIIPSIARAISRRATHGIFLIIGAIGMLSIVFIPQVESGENSPWLMLSFALIGIAWSSILSMPYAMLSSAVPAKNMGFFMGFFNVFICVPQVIASLGGLVSLRNLFFGEEPVYALALGALFMGIAALVTFFVEDKEDLELRKLKKQN